MTVAGVQSPANGESGLQMVTLSVQLLHTFPTKIFFSELGKKKLCTGMYNVLYICTLCIHYNEQNPSTFVRRRLAFVHRKPGSAQTGVAGTMPDKVRPSRPWVKLDLPQCIFRLETVLSLIELANADVVGHGWSRAKLA